MEQKGPFFIALGVVACVVALGLPLSAKRVVSTSEFEMQGPLEPESLDSFEIDREYAEWLEANRTTPSPSPEVIW